MPNKISITCLLIWYTIALSGQFWMLQGENKTFTKEIDEFNQYWKDKKPGKGEGYNQFRRFEYFYESRLMENGDYPSPDIIYKVWESEVRKNITSSKRNNTSNWIPSGPDAPSNSAPYQNVGRVNCMAFHPKDPNTLWVGTPAGGIWKTTNHGKSWIPLTDFMPNLGVSSIIVDPIDPNIIYWATGDADGGNTRTIGVLKSIDGGNTWRETGFTSLITAQHRIYKMVMHPSENNTLFIATTNGIWKTTDGGATWKRTITSWFPDIEFHPKNPSVMYAPIWLSNGKSKLYISTDEGNTWFSKSEIAPNVGRINIAIHPDKPDRVLLVCIRQDNGGLEGIYETNDQGETYNKVYNVTKAEENIHGTYFTGTNLSTKGQGGYNNALIINHSNPLEIFIGGVNTWKSEDGGITWKINTYWVGNSSGIQVVHADKHNFYYHPLKPERLYDCNDGGINFSDNNGSSWQDISAGLNISQIYRIAISEQNPETVMAGLQDNGSKDLSKGIWKDVWGGDGMQCQIDPTNSNIKYAMSQNGGSMVRTPNNWATRSSILGKHPEVDKGSWITPYILAPNNPGRIYTGMKGFYKSDNTGATWEKLCDSLTGGPLFRHIVAHPTDTSIFYSAITNKVFKSQDGGATWRELVSTSPRTITSLVMHDNNPDKLYITLGNYTNGIHVNQSTDGGENWTNITFNLPNIPANTIVANKENNTLYVGTDLGVYYKEDQSNEWKLYSNNLPNTIVNDLKINYSSNTLWAATYGRGLWSTVLPFSTGTNEEYFADDDLTLYPNPVKENITIKYTLANSSDVNAAIFDVKGRKVMEYNFGMQSADFQTKTIPTSPLEDGLYFLKLSANRHSIVRKFMIMK